MAASILTTEWLTTEQVLERLAAQPPLQRFEIMRVLRAVRIDHQTRFRRSEVDASFATLAGVDGMRASF